MRLTIWTITALVSTTLAVPIFQPIIGNGTFDQTNRTKRCRRQASASNRSYYNQWCYYPYFYNCYNPCTNWPIPTQVPPSTRPPNTKPTPTPAIDPTPPVTRPPCPVDPTPPTTIPTYKPVWPTNTPCPVIDPTPPATRPPCIPTDPTSTTTRPTYWPVWPTKHPCLVIDPTPPTTRPTCPPIYPTTPTTRPTYRPVWPTQPPCPPIDPTTPVTRPPYTPIWPTRPPRPPIDPTPPVTRPPYTPIWPTRPPRPPIDPTPPVTRPPYTPIWPTRPPRPPIDPTPPVTRPPYTPIWPTKPPRPPIDPTPPVTRPPLPPIDPTPPVTRPPYTPIWPTRPTLPTFPPITSSYFKRGCNKVCVSDEKMFYCCENSSTQSSEPEEEEKECPLLTSLCPKQPDNRSHRPLRRLCMFDNQCGKGEGCCYDNCQEDYVCIRLVPRRRRAPYQMQSYELQPQAQHSMNARSTPPPLNITKQAVFNIEVVGPWDELGNEKFLKEELLPLTRDFSPYVSVRLLPDIPQGASRRNLEMLMCVERHLAGQNAQATFALCLARRQRSSPPTSPKSRGRKCAREQRQRWRPLKTCVRSGEGRKLLQQSQQHSLQLLQTTAGQQATSGARSNLLVVVDGMAVKAAQNGRPEGWLARLALCGVRGRRLLQVPKVASLCSSSTRTSSIDQRLP